MEVRDHDKEQIIQSSLGHSSQTLDHHQFNIQQQSSRYRIEREQNPDSDPPSNPSPITYKECLKNHAAGIGGHVIDGCGEFMPRGEAGSPDFLKCAACDCHRSFHRKEISFESQHFTNSDHHTTPPPSRPTFTIHHHRHNNHGRLSQPVMMTFGGPQADSSSEELKMFRSNADQPASKKRFRTKFSREQKVKMMGFAKKLEWKIQKENEQEVEMFCSEIGIKRQVFKVWMHNNKHVMKHMLQ